MKTTDTAALLPCPFCGCSKRPELKGNGIGDNWLECTECGASTRLREDGAGNNKDWNRRATTPQTEGAIQMNNEQRKTISDAIYSLSLRADELKESNTSMDGKWCDDEEKALHDAEVALISRLRADLAASKPAVPVEQTAVRDFNAPYAPIKWPHEITAGHIKCLIEDHQRDGKKQLDRGLTTSGSYLIRVAESFRWCLEKIEAAPAVPVDAQDVLLTNEEMNALTKERFGNMHQTYAEGFRRLQRSAIEANSTKARAALQAAPAADVAAPGMVEGWIAFSDRLPPTKDNGRGDTARQKVLVTNNILARDAFGDPSHVWLGSPFIDNETGEWRVYEGGKYLTHWMDPFPVSASTGDQAEGKAE